MDRSAKPTEDCLFIDPLKEGVLKLQNVASWGSKNIIKIITLRSKKTFHGHDIMNELNEQKFKISLHLIIYYNQKII